MKLGTREKVVVNEVRGKMKKAGQTNEQLGFCDILPALCSVFCHFCGYNKFEYTHVTDFLLQLP